jgi:hypothetical protein
MMPKKYYTISNIYIIHSIADYNTLNNLKTSLKKSYGDNVKNKPQPQALQKPTSNMNTVKEKSNQINKNSYKSNGNQQDKGKQVNNLNTFTKPLKEISRQVGSKSNKQNSKDRNEVENVKYN